MKGVVGLVECHHIRDMETLEYLCCRLDILDERIPETRRARRTGIRASSPICPAVMTTGEGSVDAPCCLVEIEGREGRDGTVVDRGSSEERDAQADQDWVISLPGTPEPVGPAPPYEE